MFYNLVLKTVPYKLPYAGTLSSDTKKCFNLLKVTSAIFFLFHLFESFFFSFFLFEMSILTERYIEFVMAGRDLNPITNTLLPDRERARLHDSRHTDTTYNDTQRNNQIQKLWPSTWMPFVSFMTHKIRHSPKQKMQHLRIKILMPIVSTLSVAMKRIMLIVVKLSVVMLNVMASWKGAQKKEGKNLSFRLRWNRRMN